MDPRPCKPGFVWREAFPGDFVCVEPHVRSRVAEDNRLAHARVQGGAAVLDDHLGPRLGDLGNPVSCCGRGVARQALVGFDAALSAPRPSRILGSCRSRQGPSTRSRARPYCGMRSTWPGTIRSGLQCRGLFVQGGAHAPRTTLERVAPLPSSPPTNRPARERSAAPEAPGTVRQRLRRNRRLPRGGPRRRRGVPRVVAGRASIRTRGTRSWR